MARPLRTPSLQIGPDVLAAALEILNDEGPDGLTIRALAARAGVAPMAIYNHFQGKNGVLEALWIEGFEQMSLDLAIFSDDPKRDLLDGGLAYRSFALEHRGHYTVMVMHNFAGFEPSIRALQVAAQTFYVLVNQIERCQATGLFRNYRALDVAQMLWGTCHGFVSLEILNINFSNNPDEAFLTLLNGLWNGLALGPSS